MSVKSLILALAIFALSTVPVFADITSGLVAYWNLNDGTGTSALDGSGKGNTGTLTNGPTWTLGKRGKAVSFDGVDDDVSLGDVSAIENKSQATWSLWVKATFDGNIRCWLCKADPSFQTVNAWAIQSVYTGWNGTQRDVLVAIPSDPTRPTNSGDSGATNGQPLINGQWNHVVVVFDGTQTGNSNRLRIYINGTQSALDFVGTIPATLLDTTAGARIGRASDNSEPFEGSIDEVRIYDRALSGADVTELYNNGNSTPLLAWWKFDEGTGTLTEDSSGNGNHGTLTNGATWTTGQKAEAVNLDGTNDYIAASGAALGSQSISVAAWVKFDTLTATTFSGTPGDNAGAPIFSTRETDPSKSPTLCISNSGGSKTLTFAFDTVAVAVGAKGSTVISTGQWYHVVGTFDYTGLGTYGGDWNVYLNGVLDNGSANNFNLAGSASFPFTGTSWTIGSHAQWPSSFADGIIDDLRIYNRALSSSEVAGLYDASTKPIMRNGVLRGGRVD